MRFLLLATVMFLLGGAVFGGQKKIGEIAVGDRDQMPLIKSVWGYSVKLYITPDESDVKKAVAKLSYVQNAYCRQIEIRKLWVRPEYRKMGLATYLLNRVKNEEMCLSGAREVQLSVGAFELDALLSLQESERRDNELVAFYQKRGFVSSDDNELRMVYPGPQG